MAVIWVLFCFVQNNQSKRLKPVNGLSKIDDGDSSGEDRILHAGVGWGRGVKQYSIFTREREGHIHG